MKQPIKRVAIVTGGGTWLGEGAVKAIAEMGHDVLVVGRRVEPIRAVAERYHSSDATVDYLSADVANQNERERIVDVCIERFGRVDILVNNAGISHFDPLFDYSEEGWDRVHDTNEKAPFYLSVLAAQDMRKRHWGRIVNVASVYGNLSLNYAFYKDTLPPTSPGDRGPVRATAYHASKGGLINLTRELAVSLGEMGITVNMVLPGMCPPDDPAGHGIQYDNRVFLENTPMKMLGRPEHIGHAVAYFLQEEAGFTTGTELVVDGGWSIW